MFVTAVAALCYAAEDKGLFRFMHLWVRDRLCRASGRLLALLCLCLIACGRGFAQSLPVQINFQPAASPVPAGYLKDSGEVYGDRGNGYAYGWNQFASISRDYDSANSQGRQDYDTVIATNGLNWEIALPSGGYRLTLCVGNPTLTANTRFKMLAEGQTAVDETVGPTATNGYFAERSVMVTVTDGKLTLTNAGDIPNNNVCYLKIEGDVAPQQKPVLTASAGAGVVNLSWTPVPGATCYKVLRSAGSNASYSTLVDNYSGTSYTDTTVAAGTVYYYKVIAKNQTGTDGEVSNEVSTQVKGGIKINCGGSEYVSATLGKFRADAFFSGGSAYTLASGDVQGTEDDALYRAMRAGSGTFTYTFSGLGTGSNDLVLHFVEPTAGAAGARKFNVVVNGVTKLSNFDVFAEAGGKLKAITRSLPVAGTSTGQATVSFVNVTGNAIVSAIELYTAPTVMLTAPADGASFTAPATINLTAEAADLDGYVTRVEFYAGETKIAEDAAPVYNSGTGKYTAGASWNTVADGAYEISARAYDNDGRVSVTGTSHVTVGVAKPTGATTLTAIADAYVRGGLYADGNFGTVSPLLMRNDPAGASYQYEGYLKFDISGLTQFTNVQLQLSARLSDAASQRACTVYGVSNTDWTETGITWNNKPTAGDALGSFTPASAAYNWCSVDVTSHVQAAKNNHQDYVAFTVKLNGAAGTPYVLTYARETAAGAPRLVVGAFSANQSPTVALTEPVAQSQFTAPAAIRLKAAASDPDGGITRVEFWANGQKVGEDTSFDHSFTWTNVTDNVYYIVARAFDNDGAMAESAPVKIWMSKTPVNDAPVVAVADAHVQGGASAAQKFGTMGQMLLRTTDPEGDNTRYAYLKFLVPPLPLAEKATLRVNIRSGSNDSALNTGVYSIDRTDWDETGVTTGITFANKPDMNNRLGTFNTRSTTFAWQDVDVTAAVRAAQQSMQQTGQPTMVGFGLKIDEVATFGCYITARETEGQGPQLVIGRQAPNAAPQASITSPASGSNFAPGSTIAVSANATDVDGAIVKVEFYAGGTKIGEDGTAPYSIDWIKAPAGSYSLTARAYDNDGAMGTSPAVPVTVNSLPTVSITAPSTGAVFHAPDSVAIAAEASDVEGAITKVEFYAGETKIGEATQAPFTITWTNTPPGNHALTARAYDQQDGIAVSAVVPILVNARPQVTIAATPTETTIGCYNTITITANAIDIDGTITSLALLQSGSQIDIAPTAASPATHSFSWKATAAGEYVLSVRVADDRGGMADSNELRFTAVALPAPTLTAQARDRAVLLSWNAVLGATEYFIYRSTSGTVPSNPIQTVTSGTTFTDSSVSNGTRYYYWVGASNGFEIKRSNQASATPPGASLTALTLSAATLGSVFGGYPVAGSVTLSAAAPPGGIAVSLASNSAAAIPPASVLVPAGSTTATFSVSTASVSTATMVSITATLGSTSRVQSFRVDPIAVSKLEVNPASQTGGASATGTVTLNAAPPPGIDLVVSLSSANSAATVPASVTVPAGQTQAAFTVTTAPVSANVSGNLTATLNGSVNRSFQVLAPTLWSVTLSPASVMRGESSEATATLNGPAPAGGRLLYLRSETAGAAAFALNGTAVTAVTIPAGQNSTQFQVYTPLSSSAARTDITVSSRVDFDISDKKSATLQIVPLAIESVILDPTAVAAGQSSTATVTLNGAHPAEDATVDLSCDQPALLSVFPTSVTIPAGQRHATVSVQTNVSASSNAVTLMAVFGGSSKTAVLGIHPDGAVATPVITPNGGRFSESVTVGISCVTEGAAIHYTLDGSTPTSTSPLYTAPFTIHEATTVKAVAVHAGSRASGIAVASFHPGKDPVVEMIFPRDGAVFEAGDVLIDLAARVDSGDVPIAKVEFYHGDRFLLPVAKRISALSDIYKGYWLNLNNAEPNLLPGAYTVRAVVTDRNGQTFTSPEVHFTVVSQTTGTPIECSDTVNYQGTITNDDEAALTPTQGYNLKCDRYSFAAVQGQPITIKVACNLSDVVPVVRLYSASGALLRVGTEVARWHNNDPNHTELFAVIPETGSYLLEIEVNSIYSPKSYVFSFRCGDHRGDTAPLSNLCIRQGDWLDLWEVLTVWNVPPGTIQPPSSYRWDILAPDGTVVATDATPDGWAVLYMDNVGTDALRVCVPRHAAVGNNYRVRYSFAFYNGNSTSVNSFFNVVADDRAVPVVAPGECRVIGYEGADLSGTFIYIDGYYPTSGNTWDLVGPDGTIVASANGPKNGWNYNTTGSGSPQLCVPASAAPGRYFFRKQELLTYSLEKAKGIPWSQSAHFDVVPAANNLIPQGECRTLAVTQYAAPQDPRRGWEVVYKGSIIASGTMPNGWSVSYGGRSLSAISVCVPAGAYVSPNYLVRLWDAESLQGVGATFEVVPGAGPALEQRAVTLPAWAEPALAFDGGGAGGAGPSSATSVNLADGVAENNPGPDMVVRNPLGPDAVYARVYRSAIADGGYASPGLSPGWIDNYEVTLQGTADSDAWGALRLTYPNGAQETLTPALGADGQPTGHLNPPSGAPYLVAGEPGAARGRWNWLRLTFKDESSWTFTPDPSYPNSYRLTRIANILGRYVSVHYGVDNQLLAVRDDAGADLLTCSYGAGGLLESVSDRYGRKVTFTFGAVAGVEDGPCLTEVSLLSPAAGPFPSAWKYGYAAREGKPYLTGVTVPDPEGTGGWVSSAIEYSDKNGVDKLIDANGNQRKYTLRGGVTSVEVLAPDAANPGALKSVQAWQQSIGPRGVDGGTTDANGKSTAIGYDNFRVVSAVNENQQSVDIAYDAVGNVREASDLRRVKTTYQYDYTAFSLGRLTEMQVGARSPMRVQYYPSGSPWAGLVQRVEGPRPGTVGDPNARVASTVTYTALGNAKTVTLPAPSDAPGATVTYTYEYATDPGQGNPGDSDYVAPYTRPEGEALGEPVAVIDPLGHVTHLRYDNRGNVVAVMDAEGIRTDFVYNALDQLTEVHLPATGQTGQGRGKTVYTYAYEGGPLRRVEVFDESGTLYRESTSSRGKEGEGVSQKVGAGVRPQVKVGYDGQYRIDEIQDGNEQKTHYQFDPVGNLTERVYPGGDKSRWTDFDDAGNVLKHVDGNGQITKFVRDPRDSNVTGIKYLGTDPAAPEPAQESVHVDYDDYGRLLAKQDASGTQTFSYDDLDNVLSVTTTYTGLADQTVAYEYYPNGSRQTMTTSAGSFSYEYDPAGRLTSLTNPLGETTTWTYLKNDWLKTRTLHNGTKAVHTYNALGQLTELTNQTSAGDVLSRFGGAGSESIRYDAAGNRTSVPAFIASSAAFSGLTSYVYNDRNELIREQSTRAGGYTYTFDYDDAGNALTFRGVSLSYNANNQFETTAGAVFAYDGNGNPTTYNGVAGYTYDVEDNLTAVPGGFSAGYSSTGLRAWKQNGSGVRTYYIYDETTPVLELNAAGAVTSINTFGDGLISRSTNNSTVYYTFDPQGSVAQRLNESEAVLSTYAFDAYGSALGTVVTTDPYGYNGQWGYYTDHATGLILCTYRYYNPSEGRWLTRDPVGYAGGINLYVYCGNNPIDSADASGFGPVQELAKDATQAILDKNNFATARNVVAVATVRTASRH